MGDTAKENTNSNKKEESNKNVPTMEEKPKVEALNEKFKKLIGRVEMRMKELEEKEKVWMEIQSKMRQHASATSSKVILDVGGKRFATSKDTLLKMKGSYFEGLVCSGECCLDDDGSCFIDRDPKLFAIILAYMRSGQFDRQRYSSDVIKDLKAELVFYQIEIPELQDGGFLSQLLSEQHKAEVDKWLGQGKKYTLLYRASVDGFCASVFHMRCDNKGPTITFIKSTGGYLFGGYTNMAWDLSGQHKNSVAAFIFTLANPHGIVPTKYVASSAQHATYSHAGYGPTFGGGHDIHICTNSNSSSGSYTSFPHSYTDSTGRGNNTFTGSKNFLVSDIEVFSVC